MTRSNSEIRSKDNSTIKEIPPGEEVEEFINDLTSQRIRDLIKKQEELLVFPERLSDKTADSTILERYYDEGKYNIRTTNIMGVISYYDKNRPKDTLTLEIGSRFDSTDKQLFFAYLLSQVFDFNIVDWKPQAVQEKLWDLLLVFLFVFHLEKAYRQGLFKQYVRRKYNEYSFKGALDVQTHIRKNFPFTGKVACQFRELSYDNPVLRLVRYTTDYIHNKYRNLWRSILINKWVVNEAVRVMREATPSYSPQNRPQIYHTCTKPLRHPFYTEYEGLRKMCVRILRNEGLTVYSEAGERISGILFDGAWLWERYLAKLLNRYGFEHLIFGPYQEAKVFAFAGKTNPLYPDFLNEKKKVVFDAKYKDWDKQSNREDVKQILAYMYVTEAKAGGIIFPQKEKADETKDKKVKVKPDTVWMVGTPFYEIAFPIPQTEDNIFIEEIQRREEDFHEELKKLLPVN